jgi:hypothetical protein
MNSKHCVKFLGHSINSKYEIKSEENKIDYETELLLKTPIETIEK